MSTIHDADEHFSNYIHADRPIEHPSEDKLGRGGFAQSLATAIKNWHGKQSLIIGLSGSWGAGKTSVKNMAVSFLQKCDPQIPVVEFNPWNWSESGQLVESFFCEIGASFANLNIGNKEKLVNSWNAYASRLSLGGQALTQLKKASEFFSIPIVPTILGALEKAASDTSAVFENAAEMGAAPLENLQSLKKGLSVELQNLEGPVLIVIDDLDRLTNSEIRQLVRLVKENSDLPKLVFLLVYDRQIVENALDEPTGQKGNEYLKKITQVTFDIPAPSTRDIQNYFGGGLFDILGNQIKNESEVHMQRFVYEIVMPFLKNLRDVKRFHSGLSFHVGLFIQDNTLEVNPMDLVGVELLRVFEPKVYSELATNPEVVFGRHLLGIDTGQEEKKQRLEQINSLFELASQTQATENLLKHLFPQIKSAVSNTSLGMLSSEKWRRGLRICHSEFYERYFSFVVPENENSQSFMLSLVSASSNGDELFNLLSGLGDAERATNALSKLVVFASELKYEDASQIINGIFRIGETIPDGPEQSYLSSADIFAWRIINQVLLQEKNVSKRSKEAISGIEHSKALWFPVRFVSLETPDDGNPLLSSENVFDEESLKTAKKLGLDKIKLAAAENLIADERLVFYLARWQEWGEDESEVTNWIDEFINDEMQLLFFAKRIATRVDVLSGSDAGTSYLQVQERTLGKLYSLDKLMEKLSPFLEENDVSFREEYGEVMDAFKRALDG